MHKPNYIKSIILAFYLAEFSSRRVFCLTPTEYGREMAIRAHQSACWYEYLKAFPDTKTEMFGNCFVQGPSVLRQVKEQDLDNKYFGDWMVQLAMGELPKHYHDCNMFLQDPDHDPPADHSDALQEATKKPYPFRGFVHCIVDELQKTHGEKAVMDLKKRLSKQDHWKQILVERENEFRERHSSEPLKLAKQLSTQAQKWADKIADECNARHSKNDDPDRQFQGDGTGESLAMASADTVPVEDAALVAVNGWYEEIKDYPFPEGYTGDGSDSLFPKIGHFTQSVWKGSKYVGYGYASNKKCTGMKTFVVARYFPGGNMIGAFPENVNPPTKG